MNLNLWQFAVYALAVAAVFGGERLARKYKSGALVALLVIVSIPALIFDLYYTHLWAEPMWLYRIRAIPGSECLAAPLGLFVGWVRARLPQRWTFSRLTTCGLMILFLAVPYGKGYFPMTPAPKDMKPHWRDDVCLQTLPSSCGAAAGATVLKALGIAASEADLARDAHTTVTGTENWYLKRALESHGVNCRYEKFQPPVPRLPFPSIAGVHLGPISGHFIAILAETETGYIIGEPTSGRKIIRKDLVRSGYEFTGFFLVLEKSDHSP